MTMEYRVPIPLAFDDRCDYCIQQEKSTLETSIDNMLDLIVFTPKGSFDADIDFGFEYWNHEFSNINVREFNNSYIGFAADVRAMNDITRKMCEESLRNTILDYELRLINPIVKIELEANPVTQKRGAG